EWLSWVDKNSKIEGVIEFINSSRQHYLSNQGFQVGIWYQNELCGLISFHNLNWENRNTSMGYWLGEKYQGRGIMTKTCKALLNYAFTELKLHRVEIRCAEMNHRSRAIPERLGFTREGMSREAEWLYDHFVNHIVYSILAEEWPPFEAEK
ncbi:MAG TPA: GNAT family protein, partial [Bacillota bacterium]|nr:GNAT family protein [Bacillota bacterium]